MRTLLLLTISVILAATVIASVANVHPAEAVKASGMKVQQYGKNAEQSVCGDHICAADPISSKDKSSPAGVPDSTNLNAMLQRMDKIYKQHQSQIREKWSSLDSAEKIRFSQKMYDIMGKMESMNLAEHMDKIMSGNYEHGYMKGSHGEYDKAKSESCDKDARDKKDDYTKKK